MKRLTPTSTILGVIGMNKNFGQFVVQEDVERILALKISSKAVSDLLGWHDNEDGIYTVKSGY